jgi:hypothetical protein
MKTQEDDQGLGKFVRDIKSYKILVGNKKDAEQRQLQDATDNQIRCSVERDKLREQEKALEARRLDNDKVVSYPTIDKARNLNVSTGSSQKRRRLHGLGQGDWLGSCLE